MVSSKQNPFTIALMGTGGSSGRTLATVEAALRERLGAIDLSFVDTQPFNLRTGGTTFYPGSGDLRIGDPSRAGLRRWTDSWSLNMLLNGGPLMYRKLIGYGGTLITPRLDALVMCHDRIYVETALIRAARARGAATVLVQEGPFCSIGDSRPRAGALRMKEAIAPVATALGLLPAIPDYGCAGHDLVVAASEAYRERWIAAGVPAARIRIGGVPRYDMLAAIPAPVFSAPQERLRILYLVQPFAAHGKVDAAGADAVQQVLAAGLNAAAADMPLALTIRPHPRSSGDDVALLKRSLSFEAAIDPGTQALEDTLGQYDVVVGHYSSGLLESLLAGQRIVCIPVADAAFAERSEGDKQSWLTTIGVPVARTPAEFAAAIRGVRAGNDGAVDWSRVGEEVGSIDGQAAARCADAIAELVERRRSAG